MQGLDLRDGVRTVTGYAKRDLDALFQQVSTAASAQEALHDLLPAIIDTYGAAAAVLAADWYDAARAKAGVGGSFSALLAEVSDSGAHALVGWAVRTAQDDAAFRSLIEGGAQRRIANFSRLTVTGSAVADPKAAGWQRVGSGECSFCRMLIARGAVYSEATADFSSHDHCRCSATPAWSGQPRPVKSYTPSNRNTTDADRARVREYLRTH